MDVIRHIYQLKRMGGMSNLRTALQLAEDIFKNGTQLLAPDVLILVTASVEGGISEQLNQTIYNLQNSGLTMIPVQAYGLWRPASGTYTNRVLAAAGRQVKTLGLPSYFVLGNQIDISLLAMNVLDAACEVIYKRDKG